MTTSMARIAEILQAEDDFLVVSHYSPDGDAIGSMAAVGWMLTSLSKRFHLYNDSGMPERFSWLPLPAPLEDTLPNTKPRWIVVLDCGEPKRVGQHLLKRLDSSKVINIDHHQGNPLFGQLNWVDTQMSSTGEMVAGIAQHLGIPLSGEMGEALYLALVSDTGWFSYGNTSPQTMELAADIIRQGLRPDLFAPKLMYNWTVNKVHLVGQALAHARFYAKGRIGLVTASSQDFDQTGATGSDTEGLVDMIRNVRTVVAAASLRQEEPRKIKFSLRSTGDVDIRQVALRFGGGGHINASGGVINATLESAERQLVAAIQETLGLQDT